MPLGSVMRLGLLIGRLIGEFEVCAFLFFD